MSGCGGETIYQLIYRSQTAIAGSDTAIAGQVASLLEGSVRNNVRTGVTGALLFTASDIIQVLEGRCTDVEGVFERICCDLRHMELELMSFVPVEARCFGDAPMQRVDAGSEIGALFQQLGKAVTSDGRKGEAISQVISQLGSLRRQTRSDALATDAAPFTSAG